MGAEKSRSRQISASVASLRFSLPTCGGGLYVKWILRLVTSAAAAGEMSCERAISGAECESKAQRQLDLVYETER
jgi:hypothetical protein